MPPQLSPSEFDTRFELPDWRIVNHEIAACFVGPSFAAATEFLARISAEADRVAHHPDISLRYPGRVEVALTTHGAGGLTHEDASLARFISSLAASSGFEATPLPITKFELAIDALDIDLVLKFWKAVMGYVEARSEPGGPIDSLVDPRRQGPALWFQQMDTPRLQRSRMHVDLLVPPDAASSRIANAVAAGGKVIDDSHARSFWVLADPEGNEVCICTWQDRD